jgi:hypothetical protein
MPVSFPQNQNSQSNNSEMRLREPTILRYQASSLNLDVRKASNSEYDALSMSHTN